MRSIAEIDRRVIRRSLKEPPSAWTKRILTNPLDSPSTSAIATNPILLLFHKSRNVRTNAGETLAASDC
jgi:hypothetical protein